MDSSDSGFQPDAIHVARGLPILFERGDGDAVAHQPAGPGELGVPGDRR